jgi:hypothetical protein
MRHFGFLDIGPQHAAELLGRLRNMLEDVQSCPQSPEVEKLKLRLKSSIAELERTSPRRGDAEADPIPRDRALSEAQN